jgi:hypothetical protein
MFLLESVTECTGERARGQFNIFGAIEEKGGCGFSWKEKVGKEYFCETGPHLERVSAVTAVLWGRW